MSESNIEKAVSFIDASPSLSHLSAYPLVHDIVAYLSSIAAISFIFNYLSLLVKYVATYVAYVTPLKNAIKYVDSVFDEQVLTNLDKFYPYITKITLSELIEALRPSNIVKSVRSAFSKRYHDGVNSIVKRINSVSSSVRLAVASRLGFIFAPINKRLESVRDTYFAADGAEKVAEETSNVINNESAIVEDKDEIEKLYFLTSTIYERAKPKVSSAAGSFLHIPSHVSVHISTVYKDELSNSQNSQSKAFVETSRKLSNEALSSLRPMVEPVISRVGALRGSAQSQTSNVADAAENKADGLVRGASAALNGTNSTVTASA
ncbi:hypothetical protein PACTADRAFT_4270 [Pachysolen tannophilus NRRL Y-2460]|uniref:Uncharacterized protein n=1 Tax=Pachysolen tannophilus NRRL Y-2460 TaxID=669874 RepID=A0A1E4TRF3_PACTA|nr:hypothetical protein PACTADRAFT_4270 [Pachysolen tannophilus NRRL Y-2460]